jgi:hypothetical protein
MAGTGLQQCRKTLRRKFCPQHLAALDSARRASPLVQARGRPTGYPLLSSMLRNSPCSAQVNGVDYLIHGDVSPFFVAL